MPKLSFQYVAGEHGNETLVHFLARRFRYHTIGEWRELVVSGHVTVNGRRVLPDSPLMTRQKIVYDPPPVAEPEIDPHYDVLYEDDVILAVSKSGNIPTSPSGKYWDNCLVHLLQRERNMPELRAVHRLDRETSGVNLFAKTKEAARILGDDFRYGRLKKRYICILRGNLSSRVVYVSAPLAGDPHSEVRIRQSPNLLGRQAKSRFTLLAKFPGAVLAEVETFTGRTHQIRAHAEYIGYPIWGDKLYGQDESYFIDSLQKVWERGQGRQLLHAWKLDIEHPVSRIPISIEADCKVMVRSYLGSLN